MTAFVTSHITLHYSSCKKGSQACAYIHLLLWSWFTSCYCQCDVVSTWHRKCESSARSRTMCMLAIHDSSYAYDTCFFTWEQINDPVIVFILVTLRNIFVWHFSYYVLFGFLLWFFWKKKDFKCHSLQKCLLYYKFAASMSVFTYRYSTWKLTPNTLSPRFWKFANVMLTSSNDWCPKTIEF